MNTVKTRKVGNSLIITIPKELKILRDKNLLYTKELIMSLFLLLK